MHLLNLNRIRIGKHHAATLHKSDNCGDYQFEKSFCWLFCNFIQWWQYAQLGRGVCSRWNQQSHNRRTFCFCANIFNSFCHYTILKKKIEKRYLIFVPPSLCKPSFKRISISMIICCIMRDQLSLSAFALGRSAKQLAIFWESK